MTLRQDANWSLEPLVEPDHSTDGISKSEIEFLSLSFLSYSGGHGHWAGLLDNIMLYQALLGKYNTKTLTAFRPFP